jgi:hypothetical protein
MIALGLVALALVWVGVRKLGHSPVVAAAPGQSGSGADQTAAAAPNSNESSVPSTPEGRAAVAAIRGPIVAARSAATKALSNWRPQESAAAASPAETTNPSAPSATVSSKPDPMPSAATPPSAAPSGPRPIRLQGIVYDPTRPSAMINGKTLFVGDRLGAMQVVAIDRNSATLVGGGQTNLLTLR